MGFLDPLFGYQLEGYIDASLLKPETIPWVRYKRARHDRIAGPILFLASRLARHVTGEVLNVERGERVVRVMAVLTTRQAAG